jgi:hypothetical protein
VQAHTPAAISWHWHSRWALPLSGMGRGRAGRARITPSAECRPGGGAKIPLAAGASLPQTILYEVCGIQPQRRRHKAEGSARQGCTPSVQRRARLARQRSQENFGLGFRPRPPQRKMYPFRQRLLHKNILGKSALGAALTGQIVGPILCNSLE